MKLLLLFFACSGEPPIEACEIEQVDQSGLYTMETEETWGDCGSMGTLEVEIENGLVKLDEGLGCDSAEDTWDQPTCTTSSIQECDDGTWKMSLGWHVTGDDNNYDRLYGTLTAIMDKWDGIYVCESTYNFEAYK